MCSIELMSDVTVGSACVQAHNSLIGIGKWLPFIYRDTQIKFTLIQVYDSSPYYNKV